MKAFDLQRMALDNVPVAFLGKWRCVALHLCSGVSFLKGDRTTRRTANVAFEVLIILTLGSAAGDVAFMMTFRCSLFWWYSSPGAALSPGYVADGA